MDSNLNNPILDLMSADGKQPLREVAKKKVI